MLVSDLWTLFLAHKRNLGDVSPALFIDWCDEINRFAYRIIYNTEAEQYITRQNITVIPGTADYDLEATVETMDTRGCGVFVVDNGVDTSAQLPRTGFGSGALGYYINGSSIVFTPVPTATATYALRHVPTINAITAMTSLMVIPDSFKYYVRDALDVRYTVWDEDPNGEGGADQRFVRALYELGKNISIDNSVAGLDTLSGFFS